MQLLSVFIIIVIVVVIIIIIMSVTYRSVYFYFTERDL